MTDPTTGPHDDALDSALRGMARPVVDPARREMHIAAALEALEAPSASDEVVQSNVVSLASRRRTRLTTLGAVAAAGLFVVGLGIGRASAPKAEAPSTVKNAALDSVPDNIANAAVEGCPDLTLDAPGERVTAFGTYALYRTGGSSTATLVVVDTTACTIVTRIASPTGDGD
ncbi:MAG: hypothetical protein ACKOYL_05875 [Actinomycetota bacterium]